MRKRLSKVQEYDALWEKYQQVLKENAELTYQLNGLKEETEHRKNQDTELRSLHQNARKLKHDMKNHFMVIAAYLNGQEYEAAKAYTSDILDKLNTMHSYVETGNLLMNHILNEKLFLAREHGIVVKAEIENLSFKRLKSIDFSAILSNLLDNAIEACLKEQEADREISIMIAKRKGYETICVKNKITASVLDNNPELKSTKEDTEVHGIGLSQIRTIVDACGGMYDFYEEEGFFCVNVFIPQ